MDTAHYAALLDILHGCTAPSTGCTEPCAIALNTATARLHARGEIRRLLLRIDEFLFKNAMGVGIPGAKGRGVALCAAMGLTAGDAGAGYNVLHAVTPAQADEAQRLVDAGVVSVEVRGDCDSLFLQSILYTDEDCVRVTTVDRHDNIVDVCHAPFSGGDAATHADANHPIRAYALADLLSFVDACGEGELAYLREGVEMNLAVARAGAELPYGRAMHALLERGALADCPVTRAKLLCANAAYARMSGLPVPVMTATGSGNQGITVTLTIEGVAEALAAPPLARLRALALAHLVNVYSKAHVGNLSALCSCGVASGLAASVGIVYLLGGTARQMLLAAQNMIGSICGMICDGAKEGCANKVELAAGLAVQSAYLATDGIGIPPENGILADEWQALFQNLGTLSNDGMRETNRVIVRIMQK